MGSLVFLALSAAGCTTIPDGISPVGSFQAERYLGTWYEIARLDHRFERGLESVSASYELNRDGTLAVTNRGFLAEGSVWKEAHGKARFVGGHDTAHLGVSFFGPFYGSYVVFDLDTANYQYAFVCGPDRGYLWFLSRTKEVSPSLRDAFVRRTKALGFDTSSLIWVKQGNSQGSQFPI